MNIADIDYKFIKSVEEVSGQKVSDCYQCGKCTAGCPAAHEMAYNPNQIMRLMQIGKKETILGSNSIWFCLSCATCTARCPHDIDIAAIFEALRIITIREGKPATVKAVKLFYDVFMESTKRLGRLHDVSFLMEFNMRSGKIFNDASLGPKMLGRGKLHIIPKRIKGASEMARIYKRVKELAGKEKSK